MNRLFRISFDTLLTSITPILGYFLLGILVDKSLINVFSLVYPMQFVISCMKCMFGTGANVSAIKDQNKNSTFSGMVIGSGLGLLILGFIIFNIDKYITFMNMDVNVYRVFAIYAVSQMFLQLLLNLFLCKLYYDGDNKRANKFSICFNLINFFTLIFMSIVTKNQIVIASITLFVTSVFVIIVLVKNIKVTQIKINLLNCIKYDSVALFAEISMFIIYLFGFKNSFNFGEKYILATSFVVLITDTQWDILYAVKTVAQIDITKRTFSYKEHITNAYKLTFVVILSSIIMGLILYPAYKTDIIATLIILSTEIVGLALYPIYITNLTFIQMEHSAVLATLTKQFSNIIRIFCSFIYSPYCTTIGLALAILFQVVSTWFIIIKNKLNMEQKPKLRIAFYINLTLC